MHIRIVIDDHDRDQCPDTPYSLFVHSDRDDGAPNNEPLTIQGDESMIGSTIPDMLHTLATHWDTINIPERRPTPDATLDTDARTLFDETYAQTGFGTWDDADEAERDAFRQRILRERARIDAMASAISTHEGIAWDPEGNAEDADFYRDAARAADIAGDQARANFQHAAAQTALAVLAAQDTPDAEVSAEAEPEPEVVNVEVVETVRYEAPVALTAALLDEIEEAGYERTSDGLLAYLDAEETADSSDVVLDIVNDGFVAVEERSVASRSF